MVEAGEACADYHDKTVRNVKAKPRPVRRDLGVRRCQAEERREDEGAGRWRGDVWTWTALDADSKLIVSYMVGGRDSEYAMAFMDDVAERLANRVQITTDGHKAYLEAVEGLLVDVDYAQLVKLYGSRTGKHAERRYSVRRNALASARRAIKGNPIQITSARPMSSA